jgi:hypothetical protein
MDGVVGLEPTNDRIKICWLTSLPTPQRGYEQAARLGKIQGKIKNHE